MTTIIISGPTAIGKTNISIEIAERSGLDIISADSIQIYKNIDMGTGKPNDLERKRVKFHLIDMVETDQYYSAYDFFADTKKVLKNAKAMISGGTGLYIETLIRGIAPDIPSDNVYRKELDETAKKDGSWSRSYAELKGIDPEYALKISENDGIRIKRALEVYKLTGKRISDLGSATRKNIFLKKYILINLCCERKVLYERINDRVEKWFKDGWIDQIKDLYEAGKIEKDFKALGFKQIIDHIQGGVKDRNGLIEKVKTIERNYAKRQITWFKKYAERIDIHLSFNLKEDVKNILKGVKNGKFSRPGPQ